MVYFIIKNDRYIIEDGRYKIKDGIYKVKDGRFILIIKIHISFSKLFM